MTWTERRAVVAAETAVTERALPEVEGLARQVQQSASVFNNCRSELDRFHRGIDDAARHAASISEHFERSIATAIAAGTPVTPGTVPPARGNGDRWTHASVCLNDGVGFEVVVNPDADDPVSAELAHGNSSNQSLVSLMLELIRPGDRILDIGSHVGTFSLAAAATGAHAMALDASPENVALLRASTFLNSFDTILAVHAAASDAPGFVDFLPRGPWGQVLPNFPGTVKVPAVTVGELVDELHWHPLSFVKIDVEGSEMKTLRGMADLLQDPAGPAVLYESNAHTLAQFGLLPGDLIGYLESLGYASYLVDRPQLVLARPDDIQPQTIVDYLAVKRYPMGLAAAGWQVLPGMSAEDWIERVVGESSHPDVSYRIYALDALGRTDPEVVGHPSITAALAALAEDPDDGVRAAARSWTAAEAPDAKEDSS